MKQRTVTIIAIYLSKRPIGRLVRVRKVGDDDYLIAIEDVRDGRTQLVHSAPDLGLWLRSFKEDRCVIPRLRSAGVTRSCTWTGTLTRGFSRIASGAVPS